VIYTNDEENTNRLFAADERGRNNSRRSSAEEESN
jgi:hypothetical protein